ncbi:MAG: hypothetical protein KTR30_02730 [Saprospiraceae bacterium]|nr:hypothetical protein [Saprospiraceae bacterium]
MKVYLIGFMGSGKSFLGQQLAAQLNLDFYDLDDLIEQKAGMLISKIFEDFGEDYFREIEKTVLHETTRIDRGIISTGGGAPCFFDNIDWMNQQGLTIYLQTEPQLLAARLEMEMTHRPLLAQLSRTELVQFIEDKVASRAHFYEQAQITWAQDHSNQSDWGDLGEKIRVKLFDPGKI